MIEDHGLCVKLRDEEVSILRANGLEQIPACFEPGQT